MQSQNPSCRKARELPVGSEPLQRLALEDAVLGQVVEDARLEAEEAAVDPALDLRLLVEAAHQPVVVELRDPELAARAGRPSSSPGRRPRGGRRQRREIDVGDPVRVGGGECPSPIRSSATLIRPPVGVSSPVSTQLTSTPIRPGARLDPALDLLALVAREEQEPREALRAVDRDHVPEDRASADLDERLRNRLGPLAAGGCPARRRGSRLGQASPRRSDRTDVESL